MPFFFIVSLAVPDFDPDIFCTFIANNTKIKDPTACNKFITCIDQKPQTGVCEGDLFYDRNLQKCVEPDTIDCYSSNPCAVQPNTDGFVPDPYSCSSYYYCQNDKGVQGHCSAGRNFNPITKNCILNFPCQERILPEDYCNIVPDGVFIKVLNSCVSYQVCWHGQLVNGRCPETFFFNAFKGDCGYVPDGDCGESTTPLVPTEPPSNVKCYQPDVFVSDGVSCNGYYYCDGQDDGSIKLIHGVCPFYRFFDADGGGVCVLRYNTVCNLNRCVTFGYNQIQLANKSNDGCTGFLICESGEVIGQAECPIGKYFNELQQMCTTKVIAYPACRKTNITSSLV